MLNKVLNGSIQVIALAMALVHLVYIFYSLTTYSRFTIIHVTFAIVLVLLVRTTQTRVRWAKPLLFILAVSSLSLLVYTYTQANRLELEFGMGLDPADFWIGAAIIAIFIIATYLTWGVAIPIITLIAVVYFFFGSHIPGALGSPPLGKEYVMTYLVMGISSGVFGYLLPTSASLIFYFMLFGGIIEAVGVLPMFLEFGKWLGSLFRGGAALTSIVGSSLVGTVTGATVANVAMTGQYTIPTMKSQGFPPYCAAAVEEVASSGGQIMPPIMGAGAFLMSAIIGISYWNIAVAAIVPALTYYAIAVIGTMAMIRHYNIRPKPEKVDRYLIHSRLPVFLIPMLLLLYMLYSGISPGRSVVMAMFATILIATVYALLRWIGVRYFQAMSPFRVSDFLKGIAGGAIAGAQMAIAIVAISIVAQAAITTGLGTKLAHTLTSVAGNSTPLALIMVTVVTLILGMGVPTVAAYSIVAIVMMPTLVVSMGFAKLPAHFFAFYFAVFAAITPPVASAALVAAKLAKCSYWAAGLHGFRLSIPLLLLPFAWMTEPGLLAFPGIGLGGALMVLLMLLAGLAIAMVTYRHFLLKLNSWEWLLTMLATGLAVAYVLVANTAQMFLAFIAVFGTVVVSQYIRWRAFNFRALSTQAAGDRFGVNSSGREDG